MHDITLALLVLFALVSGYGSLISFFSLQNLTDFIQRSTHNVTDFVERNTHNLTEFIEKNTPLKGLINDNKSSQSNYGVTQKVDENTTSNDMSKREISFKPIQGATKIDTRCNMSGSKKINVPEGGIKHGPKKRLIQYLLDLINNDRKNSGLSPVKLSYNVAAQIHAEDMLHHNVMTHWTSDGMKPYMRYSLYGGKGYVAQNIASFAFDDIKECKSGIFICESKPLEWLRNDEHQMMYDDAASNWGHRDNILDKHHTHVSLGIALDDYSLYIVQNFENNYLNVSDPIMYDSLKSIIWIQGPQELSKAFVQNQDFGVAAIYYDNLPSVKTYEENMNSPSYGFGKYIGNPDIIDCTNNKQAQVGFSIAKLAQAYQHGVYTLGIFSKVRDNEPFMVSSISVSIS